MSATFNVGDPVQTAMGKGIVREVRRHGRLLVEVKGRALELDAKAVSIGGGRGRPSPPAAREDAAGSTAMAAGGSEPPAEIDLHGLTVDEALVRLDAAINDALLADRALLRVIHGRSGGRIRGAVHRRLAGMSAVRAFHVDPGNPGVTVVVF